MSKISYNAELLKIMSLFERITKTNLKDCFIDQNSLLTFVVKQNQIGKAIGKNAVNVKKIQNLLNRKIKIVEFNSDLIKFVRNLIAPLKILEVKNENHSIFIKGSDVRTKGLLIGKNSKNLRNLENIVKKYFKIKEIKVI
jgi:N utilization substance protein A